MNASKITDFLYVGIHADILGQESLKELNITHILNVSSSEGNDFNGLFEKLYVPISNFGVSNISDLMISCCDFIEKARQEGGKVYLHCQYGQNRSPCIAVAYFMSNSSMRLTEAIKLVKEKRQQFSPHELYVEQLEKIEQSLFGVK